MSSHVTKYVDFDMISCHILSVDIDMLINVDMKAKEANRIKD